MQAGRPRRRATIAPFGIKSDEARADEFLTVTRARPVHTHALLAGLSLVLLVLLCLPRGLLGHRLENAVADLDEANPSLLWAAAGALLVMTFSSALAWRTVLRACGSPLSARDAAGRYGVGTGVNALAPAHLGSAVRIVLFGRVVEGGAWTVGGAGAAVGAIRTVCMGALIAAAAARGIVPWWPVLAGAGLAAVIGVAAVVLRNSRAPTRVHHALAAARALSACPRDVLVTAAWSLVGVAAKVAAAALVLSAFDIDRAVPLAVVLVPAVELAAVLPVTPGNVGVASAAAAFGLQAQGVAADTALAAGIAFGAVELLSAVAVGAFSVLALGGARMSGLARVATAAGATSVIAAALGATVIVA
jgi:uncharacterized membrane protein YbhN (UPF0104 family)